MSIPRSLPVNKATNSRTPRVATKDKMTSVAIAHPLRGVTEDDDKLLMLEPTCLYLNLEDLNCFEVVNHQFASSGITFNNAIALQPSNPAYPPLSQKTVLLGAPRSGWLEIIFSQPIKQFCCYVTSSQRTILSAYDQEGQLLAHLSTAGPNLADSESQISPNAQLKLEYPNVYRITLYAFDGQLTVADLNYSI